jgi:hypothetical protein
MAKNGLKAEYDFSKLGKPVRGKYAAAYKQGSNLVLLDEDVAKAFPNEKAVNEALRLLMDVAKRQSNSSKRTH